MKKPRGQTWQKNLTPHNFKPGHTGNPRGGPRGPKLANRLKQWLREHPEDAELIIAKLVKDAIAGDSVAVRTIFDQHDGPLALKIEGLSDEDMIERLIEVFGWLKERLPVEHHPLLGQALYELGGETDGDGQSPEPDPE